MTSLQALLLEQPAAFWLAAGSLVAAVAVAVASPRLLRSALAGPAAALTSLAAPHAPLVALAVFVGVGATVAAWGVRLRRGASLATAGPPAPADDALLLGRMVRACAPFDGDLGRITVDGRIRTARLAPEAPRPAGDGALRVVRVEEDAVVVRPVEA